MSPKKLLRKFPYIDEKRMWYLNYLVLNRQENQNMFWLINLMDWFQTTLYIWLLKVTTAVGNGGRGTDEGRRGDAGTGYDLQGGGSDGVAVWE